MSTSIASDERWPTGLEEAASRAANDGSARVGGRDVPRAGGLLGDVLTLLLVVWLIPFAILLVGLPVAAFIRILLEIAQRI